ncbi:sulfate adenylyltransferase subunit CysN [Rhodopila globiformis]|uniref:Sulfate adenylyltransferase subunit 1 n=1 Tax=Rhodopila globiformis TaxID=1071 RepID=A0A2S6NNN2_RHOGL|nr:sulfate adenylyltransferase subunit CysN [Rhodopila globiformis]PPQ39033.1 sulfate adenylyltransferase subunit CysN [Rhodopila globiformis]
MSVALADTAPLAEVAVREASLLRFLTCGSVDDGKSTLLGRLLFDSHAVLDDQLAALDRDSRKFSTHEGHRDFALLVDGLSAEREQGITIDVAYRYFSTPKRSFIVADTPGHEQYTRNMATGASTAELAIILVDARKGILPQTRRHSFIVSMVGVRHVVLAVNKMDLMGFDQAVYDRIVADYTSAVVSLGFETIVPIPMCAREGDNVAERSERTPWYQGTPLLDYLESVDVGEAPDKAKRLHLPVQWVNRPNLDFRGYAGTVSAGTAHVGDPVTVLPSLRHSSIARIVTAEGDLEAASVGQAVTLTLADEVDISRGDVIVHRSSVMQAHTAITARLLWMGEAPMRPGQSFIVKLGTMEANATVAKLRHAVDIHSFQNQPADSLAMNGIGVVDLRFDKPLSATIYGRDRTLGSFILIERMTNQTVALGTVEAAAQRQANDNSRAQVVPRAVGAVAGRQRARFRALVGCRIAEAVMLALIVWLLSGSGYLALAVAAVDAVLRPMAGRVAMLLGGRGNAVLS